MTLIGWALDQTNVKVVCANEQTNGKKKKKEQTNDQFMNEHLLMVERNYNCKSYEKIKIR